MCWFWQLQVLALLRQQWDSVWFHKRCQDGGFRSAEKYEQTNKNQISLHLRYFAETCNEWRDPSSRLKSGNTAPKKRRSGGEPLATPCRLQFNWSENWTPKPLAPINCFVISNFNPKLVNELYKNTIHKKKTKKRNGVYTASLNSIMAKSLFIFK